MNIEFVSYDGKYPNLCSGTLTLKINDKVTTFGYRDCDYWPFWTSGGRCYFTNGWADAHVETGEWQIVEMEVAEELKPYSEQLISIFRENVRDGCCGGCI